MVEAVTESLVDSPMVYIIDQQPFNYSPATKYGQLYFLKPAKLAPTAPNDGNRWNDNVIRQLRLELSAYVPGKDYVVPTGHPTKMLLVGMLLSQLGPRHLILGWDARAQAYHCYEVDL